MDEDLRGVATGVGCHVFPKQISRPKLDHPDKQQPVKGIMLTSTKHTGTDQHVHYGHQNQPAKRLEIDLDKPLRVALESVFSHHGNVIFTFPDASDSKIQEYLRILEEKESSMGQYYTMERGTLPNDGGIKKQYSGVTQAEDVVKAAAEDSIKCLDEVSESVLPYFNAVATELIKGRDAVKTVAAALACISGVTTRVKLLSSQYNTQFTTAGKEIGAQQMKTCVEKPDQITELQHREQMLTYGHEKDRNKSKSQITINEEVHLQQQHTHSNPDYSTYLVDVISRFIPPLIRQIRQTMEESIAPDEDDVRAPDENDVMAVILYPNSNQEVLTVDPFNLSDPYRVYFKNYALHPHQGYIDDTSLFIRIAFNWNLQVCTLWLNYNTLLPITYESAMDRLYAKIPNREGTDRFARESTLSWLSDIFVNPGNFIQKSLFQEDGVITESISLIIGDIDGRISKESSGPNANAVIRVSEMVFEVDPA